MSELKYKCVHCKALYETQEEANQCCYFEPTDEDYEGKK
tara:strand:+ start:131 stop:247 length:117 start_codon:yes stop_codon:yes gene_type:complete